MSNRTARFFEPLLRLLFPGRGRHRGVTPPARRTPAAPVEASEARRLRVPLLRGEDNALVRPFLVAHEHTEKARRRRPRRVPLLAVHGIDLGPRVDPGSCVDLGPRVDPGSCVGLGPCVDLGPRVGLGPCVDLGPRAIHGPRVNPGPRVVHGPRVDHGAGATA